MKTEKLIISPGIRVEELLTELSPAFARLRNPILRKTVARVATLQQAAMVGNVQNVLPIP